MKITDLQPAEYASYYQVYIDEVSSEYSLLEELEVALHRFIKFVQDIPMDKFNYRYAEGKWTIKEIIQHLIDSERIFAYRALRFSRNDTTELPGFDENFYATQVNANARNLMSLLNEFSAVRHATIALFKNYSDTDLLKQGIASGRTVSVRALGFIIIAHQNHHQRIFQERYL
jgi:uncharacterized damage-inducible protein DinB